MNLLTILGYKREKKMTIKAKDLFAGTGTSNIPAVYGNFAKSYLEKVHDAEMRILALELGIEPGAETASEVKRLYESNPDTNAFTDYDKSEIGRQGSIIEFMQYDIQNKADTQYVSDTFSTLSNELLQKASKQDVAALGGDVAALEGEVTALEGEVTALGGEVEGKVNKSEVSIEVIGDGVVRREDNGGIKVHRDIKDVYDQPGWEDQAASLRMTGVKDYGNSGIWAWCAFLNGDLRANAIVNTGSFALSSVGMASGSHWFGYLDAHIPTFNPGFPVTDISFDYTISAGPGTSSSPAMLMYIGMYSSPNGNSRPVVIAEGAGSTLPTVSLRLKVLLKGKVQI
jgi:hypothetical protein